MKLTGLSPPSVSRGRFAITCCAWSAWLNSSAPDRTIKPSVVLRIPSVPISISPVWKAPCGRDPVPCFFQRGSEYGPGRVCPIGQDSQTNGTKVQARACPWGRGSSITVMSTVVYKTFKEGIAAPGPTACRGRFCPQRASRCKSPSLRRRPFRRARGPGPRACCEFRLRQ